MMRKVFVAVLAAIVYVANGKSLRGMLDAQPGADPLKQLTMAADKIENRFEKASSNPQFGKDLNPELVSNVKSDSEQFWNTVKGLKPADTNNFSQEDASNLQTVVQQVAQMDDDINNPKREDKVKGEYSKIQAELKEAGVARR